MEEENGIGKLKHEIKTLYCWDLLRNGVRSSTNCKQNLILTFFVSIWHVLPVPVLLAEETTLTAVSGDTGGPMSKIWLAPTSSRTVTVTISIGTRKDTACTSTAAPHGLCVPFVTLPPNRKPACTEMSMGCEMRVSHLLAGQHLNKTTLLYISNWFSSISVWNCG